MFSFGKTSLQRLKSCDPLLQKVMHEALDTSGVDFVIVCGHRTRDEQDKVVAEGKSKVSFPNSKHNSFPAKAVDIAPYISGKGIIWDDRALFKGLARHILATAERLGVSLRWGGDWNGNGITYDEGDQTDRFVDLPHFELMED